MPDSVDSRSARQQQGIQRWLSALCQGVFEWATGMGKSFTAITIIQRMQEKNPTASCYIVVPTLYLQKQFREAVQRAGVPHVEVWVINSFVQKQRACDLLIMDEIHLFLGEHARDFPKVFSLCDAKWKLGLSATLTAEEKERLLSFDLPVVDTITMQEALRNGWISRHKTYNLAVNLNQSEQEEYKHWHEIFSSKFAYFGHDFGLAMACIASQEAREKFANHMGWTSAKGNKDRYSPQTIGANANMWNMAQRRRMETVNHCAAKYTATVQLLEKFPVKAICFSESTAFADELHKRLPTISRVYHSNIQGISRTHEITTKYGVAHKTKRVGAATLRKEAIAQFNEPEHTVRVLLTAKALDQGADFKKLNLGIETSGTGTIRQKVQRTGRVVRKDDSIPLEEEMAVFIHIYAAGTYEAGKLRRKQKGILGIKEVTHTDEITF